MARDAAMKSMDLNILLWWQVAVWPEPSSLSRGCGLWDYSVYMYVHPDSLFHLARRSICNRNEANPRLGLNYKQINGSREVWPEFCSHTILPQHYAPFIYKPLLIICMNLLLRYIYLEFMPPLASATLTNERKVRTHRTTLYMKSSYLLASDTPTKQLATRRQALS